MKKRLDVLLVERGLAESRSQAQALVMAGLVPGFDKPGTQVDDDAELTLDRPPRFVSRGGEKLDAALEAW
ncbi:MAG: S4 domain-containing protein, partial [Actinomycetota bacterium]